MMTMLCPYLNSLGIDQQHPGFRSAETRDYNLKIALQQILTVSVTALVADMLACRLAATLPVNAIRVPIDAPYNHLRARPQSRCTGRHDGSMLPPQYHHTIFSSLPSAVRGATAPRSATASRR
ncbi:hypothetical protein [Mycetohabitans rhizoxinica]|uniref:hypothetical protein n=1 Tax=Mycetohabitans rhizoxinica TaxID=412963 RepID=UPI0030CD8A35